jgi:2-polyprenyl-6-methoxyphenol hydroxylase-like FAD-dependent oxidoreductase
MHPFMGIGGGIGIEVLLARYYSKFKLNISDQDAYVLAKFLTAPNITKQNIEVALDAYDRVRLEPMWRLMACSRSQGLVYGLRVNEWSDHSDPKERLKIIKENTEWVLKWDVRKDIRDGLDWIANRIA